MKLEDAREARKHIINQMYSKGPTPKTNLVSRQLLGFLEEFRDTRPWNKPSIGYSYSDYERVGVRLEVRIAQNARKAKELTNHLKDAYGGEVNVATVVRPQISCASFPSVSYQELCRRYEGTHDDPLPIGVSIGTDEGTTGTLGFFAVDQNDSIGFVSCYHVLGSLPYWEEPRDGQRIYQPGPIDESPSNTSHIARLAHYKILHHKRSNKTDSAFAILKDGVHIRGNRIPSPLDTQFSTCQIVGPLQNDDFSLMKLNEVFKIGRSTGLTKGRINALAIDAFSVDLEEDDGKSTRHYLFDNVIEIVWDHDLPRFSDKGDSGSLIFANIDDELVAVGMVFAGGKIIDDDGEREATYGFLVKDILAAHETDWYND